MFCNSVEKGAAVAGSGGYNHYKMLGRERSVNGLPLTLWELKPVLPLRADEKAR